MDRQKQILITRQHVARKLRAEESGHDWWHIHRVTEMAIRLAQEEKADMFICQMAALLHDLADEKVVGDEAQGLREVEAWLKEIGMEQADVVHIMDIISSLSFKGGGRLPMETLEGKVVQDADRLDALGAIGIARTFAFAGSRGQIIHDPDLFPKEIMTEAEYKRRDSTAINHFYEKLLKLQGLLNTEAGKRVARERHAFMQLYLDRFFKEWNGEA
ncbi:MAG: HD domain-containing protein [Bacillus sp. (in: firmicutes)]